MASSVAKFNCLLLLLLLLFGFSVVKINGALSKRISHYIIKLTLTFQEERGKYLLVACPPEIFSRIPLYLVRRRKGGRRKTLGNCAAISCVMFAVNLAI